MRRRTLWWLGLALLGLGARAVALPPQPFFDQSRPLGQGGASAPRRVNETLARLSFARSGQPVGVSDYQQPVQLVLEDADLTGETALAMLSSGLGDEELLTLDRVAPGVYVGSLTPMKAEGAFTPHNGEVEVGSRDQLTALVQDATPGGSVPQKGVSVTLGLAQPGRFTAHLADGSDQETFVAPKEGGLLVRVLDQDEDQDGQPSTDKIPVLFESARGDKGAVFLKETVIPGRFEAILPTAYGAVVRNDARLQLGPGDAVSLSYVDLAAQQARPHTHTLDLQAAADTRVFLHRGGREVFAAPLGEKVQLLVSDPDMDTDLAGGTDQITVVLGTYRGDRERAVLSETDTPGIFSVDALVDYGMPLIADGRLSLVGADSLTVEVEDTQNVRPWAAITRRWVYDAAAPARLSVSGGGKHFTAPGEMLFRLTDLNLDEDNTPGTDSVLLTVRAEPSGYEETVRFDETHETGVFEARVAVGFKPDLPGVFAVEPGDAVVAEYTDEVSWPSPEPRRLSARLPVYDTPAVATAWGNKALAGKRLALGSATRVQLASDGLKYWNNAPSQLTGWLTGPGKEKEKVVLQRTLEGAYETHLTTRHAAPKPGDGLIQVLGGAPLKLALEYPGLAKGEKLTFTPGVDGVLSVADSRGKDSKLPRLNYSQGPLRVRVVDLDRDTDQKGGTDSVVVQFAVTPGKVGKGHKALAGDVESLRLTETTTPGVFLGVLPVSPGKGRKKDAVLSGLANRWVNVMYDDGAPLQLKSGAALAYVPFWEGEGRYVLTQGHTTLEADPDGQLTVTLHDPDLDHDGEPATEQVKARLAIREADEEALVLRETDLPGIFQAVLPYNIGTWFDRDGVVQFTGLEPVLLTYDDVGGHEKIITQTPVVLSTPTKPENAGPADDFFLVALADLVAGNFNVQGDIAPLDSLDGFHPGPHGVGKASFYAIGKIKGATLLEASYDSERRRHGNTASSTPSPDAYYPVYGDTSSVSYDAVPLSKLYVKVSRKVLDFVLGDYQTGFNAGEFLIYARALSGLKASYTHRKAKVLAFGAQVAHTQALDRIQGMGVSGPYRLCSVGENQATLLIHQDYEFSGLSQADAPRYHTSCRVNDFKNLTANGEMVVLETRQRDHPEILLKEEKLIRHVDYTMDLDAGTVTLKRPLASVDEDRNPVFMVVRYEYELKDASKGDVVAGGQMDVDMGKTHLSLMGVLENGRLFDRTLAGGSLHQDLGRTLGHFSYESAWTDLQAQGQEGWAQKLTLHREGRLGFSWHWLEMDDNFGDEHVSLGERGAAKHTLAASFRVNRHLNLAADASKTTNHAGESEQQGFRANYSLRKLRLSARVQSTTSPTGDQDSTGVEAGYQLTKKLALEASQEHHSPEVGQEQDIQKVGLTYQWDARTNLYVRQVDEGKADPTVFAGVTSTIQESRNRRSYLSYQLLSGAGGVRNAMLIGTQQRLKLSQRVGATVNWEQGLARQQGGADQDTSALALGLEFNPQGTVKGSARLERREQGGDATSGLFLAMEGATSRDTTVFGRFNLTSEDRTGRERSDLLFGMAYRSNSTETLNGLLSYQRKAQTLLLGEQVQQALNAELGTMLDRGLQLTLRYSLKDGDFLFADGFGVRSRSDLWLARVNRQLTTRWDAQGDYSMLRQRESHTLFRNYGYELGYRVPRTAGSTRLAMGYQWLQFKDEDYYTRAAKATGPYFRLNLKY